MPDVHLFLHAEAAFGQFMSKDTAPPPSRRAETAAESLPHKTLAATSEIRPVAGRLGQKEMHFAVAVFSTATSGGGGSFS